MIRLTRRAMIAGLAAFAVAPSASAETAAEIDSNVDFALEKLFATVQGSRELAARARGVLVMPDVIKGGLIIGGSYGEGALRINGQTTGYYSVAAASIGYQIGVQKTSHALFFMTEAALEGFRRASGWELGADAEFTVPGDGISLGIDSTTAKSPIIAFVFAQDGLLAGASLEGAKYTRIKR
ncbi:YSC84-related protein [Pikeienuella piscinae]|nr:YSC84-related protein [Pikeienuella piscinae]